MITDFAAFVGHWPFCPVQGDLPQVLKSLRALQVGRIFVSPLGAAWCHNPHAFNGELYRLCEGESQVFPVPVIDPTIHTWRREVEEAQRRPTVRLVRLLPAYSQYALTDADELLAALEEANLGVIVQTRLDDPRRHHPLARVPDVPAEQAVEAAERHSTLTMIIGGARTGEIRALADRILARPGLYADTSQMDGADGVLTLIDAGLSSRLAFGSHAPLFVAQAALARVVLDLDDRQARDILENNAEQLLARLQTTPLTL